MYVYKTAEKKLVVVTSDRKYWKLLKEVYVQSWKVMAFTVGIFFFLGISGAYCVWKVSTDLTKKEKINTLTHWNKNTNSKETKSCPIRRQGRNIVTALNMAISENRGDL